MPEAGRASASASSLASSLPPVVFYDGVCGMCDAFVQFVLERDAAARFRFAALQSPYAQDRLAAVGRRAEGLDTMYVMDEHGRLLEKSDAVLFVLRALGGLWAFVALLRFVPRPLRDAVYAFVARHRYRIFGKRDACRMPSASERARFLAAAPLQTSAGENGT